MSTISGIVASITKKAEGTRSHISTKCTRTKLMFHGLDGRHSRGPVRRRTENGVRMKGVLRESLAGRARPSPVCAAAVHAPQYDGCGRGGGDGSIDGAVRWWSDRSRNSSGRRGLRPIINRGTRSRSICTSGSGTIGVRPHRALGLLTPQAILRQPAIGLPDHLRHG